MSEYWNRHRKACFHSSEKAGSVIRARTEFSRLSRWNVLTPQKKRIARDLEGMFGDWTANRGNARETAGNT